MTGAGEGIGRGGGDGKGGSEKKGKSIVFDGDLVGQNLVVGKDNVINKERQEDPTLPPGARVVETAAVENSFDPTDSAEKIDAIMRKARKANQGESGGQDGKIKIGGRISKSNVVQGDGQRVNTAERGEDLPIGTEVAVKVVGLSVENSNVTVVDKEGRESQKFLKGYWADSRRTDAFGNKIFVREE